jgi:hypothetical protein
MIRPVGRKVVAAKLWPPIGVWVTPDRHLIRVAKKNGRTNYNLRFGSEAAAGTQRSAQISKPVVKEDAWAVTLG